MIKAIYNMIDTLIILSVGVMMLMWHRNPKASRMHQKKWCLWGGIFMVGYAVFLIVDRYVLK